MKSLQEIVAINKTATKTDTTPGYDPETLAALNARVSTSPRKVRKVTP